MSQKRSKKIVITGTHLTPALELIRQLQNDRKINWQIIYIGRRYNSSTSVKKSIESEIIPKLGIKFYSIPCGKLDRKYLPNTLLGIPKTIKGFYQARKIIHQNKPDLIISFGGYVSVPVIINAYFLRIKSITHEQTLTNSLTTKINSFFVNKIALSFDNQKQIDTLPKNKTVVTGNLIRYQLLLENDKKLIKTNKPIIYVTAGNQGSHFINLVIKKSLDKLTHSFIVHQTGDSDFPEFKKLEKDHSSYRAFPYLETLKTAWLLKNADIIISRSGANTSQELSIFKQRSILIPLIKSQQDEQLLNAKWLRKQLPNETIIISQDRFTKKTLLRSIQKLRTVKKTSRKVKVAPNFKLLKLIHEII
jgi:UDP-N-acetylglucosamine--N-acetylmuramyl-(pentapeptide) pyrophosphoryl-undecaprenol N-acetylglucosamine transferase